MSRFDIILNQLIRDIFAIMLAWLIAVGIPNGLEILLFGYDELNDLQYALILAIGLGVGAPLSLGVIVGIAKSHSLAVLFVSTIVCLVSLVLICSPCFDNIAVLLSMPGVIASAIIVSCGLYISIIGIINQIKSKACNN